MNPELQSIEVLESPTQSRRFQATIFSAATRLAALRPMFRPFGAREHESAMQFSSQGRLHCICACPKVKRSGFERRQVCRACGLEAASPSKEVDRVLTAAEIRSVVKSLQVAGVRAAGYELPTSITTLRQLNVYLASEPCPPRKQPDSEQQLESISQA